MLHLTSGWLLAVEFGLGFFCLLDIAVSPEATVRWVPRWGWALFVLTFPVAASILWLAAGHPWRVRVRRAVAVRVPPPVADPFEPGGELFLDLASLRADADRIPPAQRTPELTLAEELLAVHEEHERTLLAWESDLRRREAELQAIGRRADAD